MVRTRVILSLAVVAVAGCSNDVAVDGGEDGPDIPMEPDLPVETCGNGKVDPEEFCHALLALELAPAATMIADFDGDGLLDVGSRAPAGGDAVEFLFWPGDGKGGFGPAQPPQMLEAAATRWNVASLDGDGAADLVAVDTITGTVWSFINNGGQFGPAVLSSPSAQGLPWSDVAVFDIDVDGDDDLVIEPLERDADLFALRGDAASFTDASATYAADPECWGVDWAESPAFGQFGDGLVHLSGICNDGSPQQALTVLLPAGSAEVVAVQGASELEAPEEVVVGDFDGDGTVDLLVWDSDLQAFSAYSIGDQQLIASTGTHGLDTLCSDCSIAGPVPRPSSHAGRFGGAPATDLFLRIDGVAYFIFDPLTDAARAFALDGVSGGLDQGDFNGDGLDDFLVRNSADNATHILLSQP